MKKLLAEAPKHAYIWFVLFFALFPLYVSVTISLKDNHQFFNSPWWPQSPFHWENWAMAWSQVGGALLNSIFLCVTSTVLVVVFGLLAGYFFGRFRLPGSSLLWALFMTLMMMPSVVNLVPLFGLLRGMGLLNTYTALVVTYTTAGQVVAIFLLRGFVEDLPDEMFEAAEMDGAGHLQQVIHVIVPLSMPIISTLAILRFIASWNQFVLPLIVLRDEAKFPVGVKLYQLEGAYLKQWGPLMASYAIAAVPLIILFVFTMRYFVKGISAGAVKG